MGQISLGVMQQSTDTVPSINIISTIQYFIHAFQPLCSLCVLSENFILCPVDFTCPENQFCNPQTGKCDPCPTGFHGEGCRQGSLQFFRLRTSYSNATSGQNL